MAKLNIIIAFTSIIIVFYSINKMLYSLQNSPHKKRNQNLRMERFTISENLDINNFHKVKIRKILEKISVLQEQSINMIEQQKIQIQKETMQLKLRLLEIIQKIQECKDQNKSVQVCALQYQLSVENSHKKLSIKQKQFKKSIQTKSKNNLTFVSKMKEQYKFLLNHHIDLKEQKCDQMCKQTELITLQSEQKQLKNEIQYKNKEIKILNQYISQLQEQNKLNNDLTTQSDLTKQILDNNIFSINFLQNIKNELIKLKIHFTLTEQQYFMLKSVYPPSSKSNPLQFQ